MGAPEVKVGEKIFVRQGGQAIEVAVTRVAARGIVSVDPNPNKIGGPLYEYSTDAIDGTWTTIPKKENE